MILNILHVKTKGGPSSLSVYNELHEMHLCMCVEVGWGGRTTEQSDKQQVQELKEWKITFSKSLVVEIWIHYTPYSLQNKNW
jgi:hypothetical protein